MDKSRKDFLTKELPKITVIMPVRNEAAFIERSLGTVLEQNYPSDRMEVIVADGMSTDDTREIVGEIIKQNVGRAIRLIENCKRIFSTGFNMGLGTAQGEIIFMLGGHSQIPPDYVRRCVEHLDGRNIDCVGGYIDTIAEKPTSWTIAAGMSSPFGVGGVAFRTRPKRLMEVDTVAFGAYRSSAIDKCGLMDEEMVRNQDDEYNYRLRKLGGKIVLAPDVRARYYSRSSLKSLWNQYFRYGFWKVRVLQKHPRQMRFRQFVPPAFVAAFLGSASSAPFWGWSQTLLILIAVSYVIVNILASLITAWEKGWRHFLLLPIVFATLHLSYGSGFLVGLVRFASRWKTL